MQKNNIAIDYLRAFITVLVLAFHSFIAYASFVPAVIQPFAMKPYAWKPFPVVDSQRWTGFDLFVLFNDTFFMSLMFLLAGLFVYSSIARKGHKGYLYGRMLRLGLPLAIAFVFLNPLAYYPSYLIRGGEPSLSAYVQQWYALDSLSAGPVWFVAILLVFDVLVMLLHKYFIGAIGTLRDYCCDAEKRPTRLFFGFVFISVIAYVPMRLMFEPFRWFSFGPFAIQASRILLYPTYFLTGVAIGAWGIDRGLISNLGELARRWKIWLIAAFFAFVLFVFFFLQLKAHGTTSSFALKGISSVTFALSCCATSFFLLAFFVRFAKWHVWILDSLSGNAYGMYLIHYVFVSWTQYELLNENLSAIQKGLSVFVVTLLLSWGTVAGMRLIPFVGRILSNGVRSINASRI